MPDFTKHNDNPQEMQRFGEKLHTLRVAYDLTLVQLAHALGYSSHGYLSEIESGRKPPTALLALKVSRFFDVGVDALLKDELEVTLPSMKGPAI